MVDFIKKILGWCSHCKRLFHYPKRRRLNTAYAIEEHNWVVCCKPVYKDMVEYYKERWQEYYSGCL